MKRKNKMERKKIKKKIVLQYQHCQSSVNLLHIGNLKYFGGNCDKLIKC